MHRKYSFAPSLVLLLLVISPVLAADKAELRRHTVMADGHPMALWEKSAAGATEAILLVHGRTWSALPDFDLQVEGEDLSLMDGLVAQGYAVFAVDLRGYGETPRDATEWLTPNRAADDVAIVIEWISDAGKWQRKPHLFGWSRGSTIVQLMAQRRPGLVSSLTLFGYWLDPQAVTPADDASLKLLKAENTAAAAASDFIIPGSISTNAIETYVNVALAADPIMVDLKSDDQYNVLDGSSIDVPTLILRGQHDPIAPPEYQARLYMSLATGHKQWVTVPGGDHAAFMETPRDYFIHELVGFLRGLP
jgi:pimeloyl-ACP methyl ester carboxylesterase